MNKLAIIGNLTRDPETHERSGVNCTTFTVAVNRRVRDGEHPEADYFRVTAWRKLGETCAAYLAKGRKVYVDGPVSAYAYVSQNDGNPKAVLQMTANSVEFLTPRNQQDYTPDDLGEDVPETAATAAVADDDELPF